MLTYDLSQVPKGALYEHLYKYIRNDIKNGVLKAGEKLPSKRTLAKNLGVSTITVESAYTQLMSEGYVYSLPKHGYYIAKIDATAQVPAVEKNTNIVLPKDTTHYHVDFSNNQTAPSHFPFATWKKLLRETIAENSEALMEKSPAGGVYELREAIANHLHAFRGIEVNPDQIIVGAGTEYLYGLLIQLFGRDKIYCAENPGYQKVPQIYRAQGVECRFADMDEAGISVGGLRRVGADIAHIGPTHQFPTGITMPVSRRYELLAWASEDPNRYIIEDDYDSEFRLQGKPIPTLQGLDAGGKVVYLNTFAKSLSSTVRISYMVLPAALANRFYAELGFYACTVSNFEQFTLARFINEGYFEKHINRMRLYYIRRRQTVLDAIAQSRLNGHCDIIEQDSGPHAILALHTHQSDHSLQATLETHGIHLAALSDYYDAERQKSSHQFLLSYSNLDTDTLTDALNTLADCL